MTRERLSELVEEIYHVEAEFFWEKLPTTAVFRHKENGKWFAVLMDVDGEKLSEKLSGKVDVLTIKTDPNLRMALLEKRGVYRAYHMNKVHWISLVLSEISDEDLETLLDISFEMTKK